jgi:hypothetical protein
MKLAKLVAKKRETSGETDETDKLVAEHVKDKPRESGGETRETGEISETRKTDQV